MKFNYSRIHASKMEDPIIARVVDVLYSQLVTLLTDLCGNRLNSDADSPTPIGTPETLSPTVDIMGAAFVSFSARKIP